MMISSNSIRKNLDNVTYNWSGYEMVKNLAVVLSEK